MHDAASLLRNYVEQRSEAAFAELVRLHIPLVYSSALRRVGGDAHLAEDVTQTVFTALARKAPNLLHHATLTGWLYVTTQLASADLVRREQRRKHRETAAQSMHVDNSTQISDPDPEQLRPVLDDAIVTLKNDEREAIILRFFEKRSFVEIGTVLRVTEEAARKRVDRALEKLRVTLVRRGVTSTAAALGVALSLSATGVVPTGLAAQVSSAAVAHAAAATVSTFSMVTSLVLPATAALVVGTLLVLPQYRANESTASEIAQLSPQLQSIPSLRAENDRLSHSLAAVRELQRAESELPELRATIAALPPPTPKPTSNSINLSSAGTIAWEGKGVTLDRYLENLKRLQASAPGGESKVLIRARNVQFPQLVFVIDEAVKAGIKHIVIDSDATPAPVGPWSWF